MQSGKNVYFFTYVPFLLTRDGYCAHGIAHTFHQARYLTGFHRYGLSLKNTCKCAIDQSPRLSKGEALRLTDVYASIVPDDLRYWTALIASTMFSLSTRIPIEEISNELSSTGFQIKISPFNPLYPFTVSVVQSS